MQHLSDGKKQMWREHNVLYCWCSESVAMVTTSDSRCVCRCGEEECSEGLHM